MTSQKQLPKFTEVPLSRIQDHVLDELAEQLRSAHRFNGACVPWRHPVFMVRLPNRAAERQMNGEMDLNISTSASYGYLGASFHLDIDFPDTGEYGRVCVSRNHPAFEKLRSGLFYFVLVDRHQPTQAFFFDFSEHLGETWNTVANHSPMVMDCEANYWDAIGRNEKLRHHLTASDRLSIGWADSYGARVADLYDQFAHLAENHPIPASLDDVEHEAVRNVLTAVRQHEHDLLRTFESLRLGIGDDRKALGFLYHKLFDLADIPALSAYDFPLRELCQTIAWSSWFTECGKRFPWIDSLSPVGEIRAFEITPENFPDWFRPEEYWRRAYWGFKYELGRILSGADVPADPKELVERMGTFPRAADIDAVSHLADSFLDDALEHKKWTIPPRAVVQQNIGTFSHVELNENSGNVFCVLRTGKGEFHATTVAPHKHICTFEFPSLPERDRLERRAIKVGVKLLLSAIIRDFWVVEEREKVFACQRRSISTGRQKKSDDRPRVVYLPRVKYTQKPDVAQAKHTLGYPERRSHNVAPHLRRVESASDAQVILAKRYGFDVPEGYTFVRPHLRGKGQSDIIYKSRSAMQSLYTEVIDIVGDSTDAKWFQFERDVYDLMATLGFEVKHVSAAQHADRGIDIYATKGTDLEQINWVIQCKCWKKNRKVYPAIVRELCGVLSEQPSGTRGMIVTTSGFSTGAREKAQSVNIRLMDGEEFALLIEATKRDRCDDDNLGGVR